MPAKEKKPETADAPVGGGKLVLDEERNTGSVSLIVYYKYLRAIGSWWSIALIAATLIAGQAASVGNSLFLGYWSGSEIKGFSQGQYIAVYAGQLGKGRYSQLLMPSRSGRSNGCILGGLFAGPQSSS